eukprot:TRINITY_DN11830_c0_g1_i2.p1 TRINITY_DN11830_c0_g1~~TRINITY_DN11830_c0_g1_i2.p1  ORF type:complete len:336 (-),score=23.86 TRINITY_DN11830_c0_g1_i2:224-1231(-)
MLCQKIQHFKLKQLLYLLLFCQFTAEVVDFLPSEDSLILDEYKQPHYVIAVDKTSHSYKTNIPSGKKEFKVHGIQQQAYQCLLIEDPIKTNGTDSDEIEDENIPDPYKILDSQLSKTCLYRREGWWTYQYCHHKYVRQFHEEHEVLMSEYFLGAYNKSQDLNWTSVMHNQYNSEQISGKAGDSTQYVSLQYDQGENCDLTNEPRETEVRFACRPDLPDKNTIVQIKEPSTCKYVMIIAMPALCSHPDFAVGSPDVHQILCQLVPSTGDSTLSNQQLQETKVNKPPTYDLDDDEYDDEQEDYEDEDTPTQSTKQEKGDKGSTKGARNKDGEIHDEL